MSPRLELNVSIETVESGLRKNLFGKDSVRKGDVADVATGGCQITSVDLPRRGAFGTEEVVNIILSGVLSVPLGILASWLYELLKRKGTSKVQVEDVDLPHDQAAIEEVLKEIIARKSGGHSKEDLHR